MTTSRITVATLAPHNCVTLKLCTLFFFLYKKSTKEPESRENNALFTLQDVRRLKVGKEILVIDDEQVVLDAIEVILEDMGYEVTTFCDPK